MPDLNVVLVEPQIPQNTGNIARTCACTGAKLHIVRPMGFTVTDAHLKRAGLDYWNKLGIIYYDSVADFFSKTQGEYFFYTTKAKNIYSDVVYSENCYLLFGREDKGLPEKLLKEYYNRCVRVPMRDDLRSLNLSNTVAIGVYEVLRQWDFSGLNNSGNLHTL